MIPAYSVIPLTLALVVGTIQGGGTVPNSGIISTSTAQPATTRAARPIGQAAVTPADAPDPASTTAGGGPGREVTTLLEAPGVAQVDGTPVAPTEATRQRVQDRLREQSEAVAPMDAVVSGYPVSTDTLITSLPRQWWPYARTDALPLTWFASHFVLDSHGVAMTKIGGHLYNQPVGQAQAGLLLVESYRVNHDAAYLTRAVANAERLLATAVHSRGAYFFPYTYDLVLHGNSALLLRAPWYSAMAQGLGLSLFGRLYTVTTNAKWLDAARMTVPSLNLAPSGTAPYASRVISGYLWLLEVAAPLDDRIVNGHMFATFGLWDYWRLTGDVSALRLFQGAMATMQHYTYNGIRRTYWISVYCLNHGILHAGYHEAVTGLFTQIHALTRTSVYADYSDVFRSDYAVPTGPHQVQMSAGTRTGYTFNANGAIVARKAVTFPRATSAPGTTRTRIKGRGYFYKITAGYLSGYWLPELAPYSYMSGFLTDAKYAYTRPAVFHAGVTEAWKIDGATGRLSSPIWSTLGGGSTAHTDRIAVINGQSYAYIVDNIFAGRWVLSRPVTIR